MENAFFFYAFVPRSVSNATSIKLFGKNGAFIFHIHSFHTASICRVSSTPSSAVALNTDYRIYLQTKRRQTERADLGSLLGFRRESHEPQKDQQFLTHLSMSYDTQIFFLDVFQTAFVTSGLKEFPSSNQSLCLVSMRLCDCPS